MVEQFKELSDEEYSKLALSAQPAELFELTISDEEADGKEQAYYLYVTKPSRGAFNIFSNAVIENEKVLSASEQLVYACVKHPAKAEVAKLLESKKQFTLKILAQINKLEGANSTVTVKKRG